MSKDLKCAMVYNAVATTPSGGLYPCCRCTYDDMYWGDPKDYFDSDYLASMKSQMENGIWPKICKTCRLSEENGIISKRQRRNEEWIKKGHTLDELPTHNQLERIDLRLSNLCNLACCGCNGKDSSMLKEETIKFIDIAPKHLKMELSIHGDRDFKNPYSEEHIEQLIDIIDPHTEVYLTGGEPSLIKGVSRLLERLIEKGYNKTISLQFNSNFSAFNQHWINLVSEFKGHMMPSVDAIGAPAEYSRYGCDWNRVNTNIKTFLLQTPPGWRTTIFVTPSVFNAFTMKEVVKWFYTEIKPLVPRSYELNLAVENFMTRPQYFSMSCLSDAAKEHVSRQIGEIKTEYNIDRHTSRDFDEIIKYMMLPGKSNMREMAKSLDAYDKMRGTDWRTVFPELKYYYELEYGNE